MKAGRGLAMLAEAALEVLILLPLPPWLQRGIIELYHLL